MPYAKNSDLPKAVRDALPSKAQDIYRGAFNGGLASTKDETRAHRIAWADVKKKYKKNDQGEWVLKKSMTKERAIMPLLSFDAGARFLKAMEGAAGERLLVIAAADSGPDRQAKRDPETGQSWVAERLAPAFLEKMRRRATEGKIELTESHHSGLPIAKSVRVATSEELQAAGYQALYDSFVPVFRLEDECALADQLWGMAQAGTLDREFSVGGNISAARVVYDAQVGGYVKEITDGDVDHVAVCRPGQAANGRTGLVTAMMKALATWEETQDPEALRRAYVEEGGQVTVTPRDITEAEEERAECVWATDFTDALARLRLEREMPMMSQLLWSVLRTILDCSDPELVPDKGAAMKQAIDEFVAATEGLTGAALSKHKTATDEGLSPAAPVNTAQVGTGGRTMSTMFKELPGEGREKVAQLLGTTADQLDSLSAEDFGKRLEALDDAGRTDLIKAMQPLPALAPGDVTSIATTLTTFDALAKRLETVGASLQKVADNLATAAAPAPVAVAEPPAPVASAPVAPAPAPPVEEPTLTLADVNRLVSEGVQAELAARAASGAAATEGAAAAEGAAAETDMGKIVTKAEAAQLIAQGIKEALNKSLGPVGGQPGGAPQSNRERIVALVKEKGPSGAFDDIFKP